MLTSVNMRAMLTIVNTTTMLAIVHIQAMPKRLNSSTIGALVRQARLAAGVTQSELARRIGASRFWVAAFEKGKPSAELGLALRAIQAIGLAIHIEPDVPGERGAKAKVRRATGHDSGLADVIARTTLTRVAPSSVAGWPTASVSSGSKRSRTR